MTNEISSQVILPDTVWAWALDELAAFGRQWRQLKEREAESSLPVEHEPMRLIKEGVNTGKQDME